MEKSGGLATSDKSLQCPIGLTYPVIKTMIIKCTSEWLYRLSTR